MTVAFVLGGGGLRGGYEVGMLRALLEAGVRPDLVVGTSIGSVHGAMVAAQPTVQVCDDLADLWSEIVERRILREPAWRKVATAVRSRTHVASNEPLRQLLDRYCGSDVRIEDLAVPFACVAASIERAAAHWFADGPLVPAVLASCAVPGFWPAVEIGGEHFYDGGLVESIPIGRALELGAQTVYVLHVGRINRRLEPPRWLWQVASVSLELARRHRFFEVMESLPEHVTVHVLPTGDTAADEDVDVFDSTADQLAEVRTRIDNAYRASTDYLQAMASV